MLATAFQQWYDRTAEKGGTTRVLFRSARFRAAFVAAMFGVAPASALSQDPPPPPPPIIDQYIGNIVTNVDTAQVGEPQPARAIFSLRAADRVEAGQAITVEIVRQTHDGKAHDFQLQFEPDSLVDNPSAVAVIDDASENTKVTVNTVDVSQAQGPQTLRISLIPGKSDPQIGEPRSVDVAITRPATFEVRGPAGPVQRGSPVEFAVVRSGGSGRQSVNYNVTQGDRLVSTGQLVFDERGPPLGVGVTNYEPCGDPLSFELLSVKGETKATAAFPQELPDYCRSLPPEPPTWVDIVRDYWPFALPIPVGWFAWRFFRRLRRKGRNGKDRTIQPGELATNFFICPDVSDFPNGEPRLRVPDVEKRFQVAMGEWECPCPLPIRETVDE